MKIFSLFFLLIAISIQSDEWIFLGNSGCIHYIYDNNLLQQIDRINKENQIIYSHKYKYNENENLISEILIGNLGEIIYENSLVKSPFHREICEYDENKNIKNYILDDKIYEYFYNESNEIILDYIPESYIKDDTGTILKNKNHQFFYDQNNRLVQVETADYIIQYSYDSYGKRISRTINNEVEYFVYFGINEMAILDSYGNIKELRIPGLSAHENILRPIAIEINDSIYAPIHNFQNNIIKLINIRTKEIISSNPSDPFGKWILHHSLSSWLFAGKT